MTTWDGVTRRNTLTPFVLVVGATPGFVVRCRAAAPEGVLVGAASPANYAKQAARLRPYVIIVTRDVRALDADRFDELARAVGAEITCFADETIADADLAGAFRSAFEAVAQRREPSSNDRGPA